MPASPPAIALLISRSILVALLLARLGGNVLSEEGIGWDFVNYYNAAQRLWTGAAEDLYHPSAPITNQPPLGDARHGYYGLPLSAYVFMPLAAFQPRTALGVFKAVCALSFVAALSILYPLVRHAAGDRVAPDSRLTAYLALCLVFEPFWFTFTVGGQATAIVMLLLVLFYRYYLKGANWKASVGLSLAIMIKPVLLLAGSVVVFGRDWRFLLTLAVLGGAEVLISLSLFGWHIHEEWLGLMVRESSRLTDPWWNNSSIPGFMYTVWYGWQGRQALETVVVPSSAFQAVVLLSRLVVAALLFHLAHQIKSRNTDPKQQRHYLASLAIVSPLLLSNTVWPHYLSFLFIPLAFGLATTRRLPRTGQWLVWLIFVSVLSVQSRFAQHFVLAHLGGAPVLRALVAGLCGSCTLLLTLIFVAGCDLYLLSQKNT